MEVYRLQDKADAKRLLQELNKKESHRRERVASADDVAGPTGAGSAELVGDAGRIELDPAEVAAAEAELSRRYDELSALLTEAKELEVPLRDGSGPVSGHLRKAFALRGSETTGVQKILRDYLHELDALRDAIRQAAKGMVRNDSEISEVLTSIRTDSARG